MAAQKRKSVQVEPPAKRQKLDKNSKLVTSRKEGKSLTGKHVSDKNTVLKKKLHKTATKTDQSFVNKSSSSILSSQNKRAKNCKQILNKLKKKTGKTCMTRTSLKLLGKLSPTKITLKSSKISHNNHLNSTRSLPKICSRRKRKLSVVKNKTCHGSKTQKKSPADTSKCFTETLRKKCSVLPIKTTHKIQCSKTKVMKENSRKERTSKTDKVLKSSNDDLEAQNSKRSCEKNPTFQSNEATWTKTSDNKKPCDANQERRTTRSMVTNSKKNSTRVKHKQDQLHFTKNKHVSQKEVQDLPKLQRSASCDEFQTRRSVRLKPSLNVQSSHNGKNKGHVSIRTQSAQMKKRIPNVKKSPQQKMEHKLLKNDDCKEKDSEVLSCEKKSAVDSKTSDFPTSQDKQEKSGNQNSNIKESRNKSANTVSCTVTSCSVKSKEKQVMHRNGKINVKAKRVLPASSSPKPACQQEDAMKTKKISILELCEEIAGEIESDTVEVKRDSPEHGKEERARVEELPQAAVSAEEETNQNSQRKRFFPSKKGIPVKCTVNGRHNGANKNSKWTKIKLKKRNHVSQNISNSQSTPKHGILKPSIPVGEQGRTAEIHLPEEGQIKLIQSQNKGNAACDQKLDTTSPAGGQVKDKMSNDKLSVQGIKNGLLEATACSEPAPDESFNLQLELSPENTPVKTIAGQLSAKQVIRNTAEIKSADPVSGQLVRTLFTNKTSETNENRTCLPKILLTSKCGGFPSSEEHIQKLKEAAKDSDKQLIIDAGQKRFGAISCNVCGMLYTASNPEDETQHLFFHNQFISAVKYVGWKKERILAEYPDGKIIMVLPDDPKYALRKIDEIREMVDNDLGFQQAPVTCSRTKTLLFISNDKKVTGCLIAEHIQWGYRVIEEKIPEVSTENEKVTFERQKAWCCSTSPEPALCGISRIWVFSMMRRKKIASRMLECLRSNFIYGSYLSKEEIAFSDPTPDGKLFATRYFGTSQFLVYNFLSGQQPISR
ncbi:N-acetyltransferase ESCO1 isoform X1 [Anolis carolinensis]|uniref:N-acetyltransferase ESCO1 isoform X1 n=1 Tax=Anolis carolinensis TaxID=28377 RepID=UPI002F2B752C